MIQALTFESWSPAINFNLSQIFDKILQMKKIVIHSLAKDKYEERRLHRTLQNPKVNINRLTEESKRHLQNQMSWSDHVLFIQDTSDYVFNRRDEGSDNPLGYINDKAKGYRAHVCMALDSKSAMPLGLANVELFNREQPHSKFVNNRPLQQATERESYRWIRNISECEKIAPDKLKTIVADRESDMYLAFTYPRSANTHLLIRSCHNRQLVKGQKLSEAMSCSPVHKIVTKLPCGSHNNQIREAELEIRFQKVSLKKPEACFEEAPSCIEVYCIDVLEVTEGITKPIHWRLFTTHSVADL